MHLTVLSLMLKIQRVHLLPTHITKKVFYKASKTNHMTVFTNCQFAFAIKLINYHDTCQCYYYFGLQRGVNVNWRVYCYPEQLLGRKLP